jgi:hypothetical protein
LESIRCSKDAQNAESIGAQHGSPMTVPPIGNPEEEARRAFDSAKQRRHRSSHSFAQSHCVVPHVATQQFILNVCHLLVQVSSRCEHSFHLVNHSDTPIKEEGVPVRHCTTQSVSPRWKRSIHRGSPTLVLPLRSLRVHSHRSKRQRFHLDGEHVSKTWCLHNSYAYTVISQSGEFRIEKHGRPRILPQCARYISLELVLVSRSSPVRLQPNGLSVSRAIERANRRFNKLRDSASLLPFPPHDELGFLCIGQGSPRCARSAAIHRLSAFG